METVTEDKILEKKININSSRKVHIGDSYYSPGRDINFNLAEEKSEFSTVELTDYADEHYLKPTFTNTVYQQLYEEKVLLVYGGQGFDKGQFIRHLGYSYTIENISFNSLELKYLPEEGNLIRSIEKGDANKLYIFDKADPFHFSYNLLKVSELAKRKDLVVIISTDYSLDSWELRDPSLEACTFCVPDSKIYDNKELEVYLRKQLEQEQLKSKKSHYLSEYDFSKDALFDISYTNMVERLNSPEALRVFVSHIFYIEVIESSSELENAIANYEYSASDTISRQWFLKLKNKQRLIALAAVLFHGTEEVQFFELVRKLADSFWKYSEPSIMALDYSHLEFLAEFFQIDRTGTLQHFITSKTPQCRREILEVAWKSHKRHIINSLPVLTKVAIESVTERHQDWEKYGTAEKKQRIQLAIADTLGEMGVVSVKDVENSLLILATQRNAYLQQITARSMASWKRHAYGDQLFGLLDNWLTDNKIEEKIYLILRGAEKKDKDTLISENASYFLKTTVVFTLSFASQYYESNKLDNRIPELLTKILKANDPNVRNRVSNALPRIIQKHFIQLKEPWLLENMHYKELKYSIAKGISLASQTHQKDVKTTINNWLNENKETLDQHRKKNKRLTKEDKIVETILETICYFAVYDRYTDSYISLSDLHEWLIELKHIHKENKLRETYLKTLAIVAMQDLESATEKLPEILQESDHEEMKILSLFFAERYKFERLELEGATHTYDLGSHKLPIWLEMDKRPYTPVEEVMINLWLSYPSLIVKRIATLTLLEITRSFDKGEKEIIEDYKKREEEIRKRAENSFNLSDDLETVKPRDPGLGIWLSLKIWLRMLFEKSEHKTTIRSLIKLSLLNSRYYSTEDYNLMFEKCKRSNNVDTLKIMRWFRRFFTGKLPKTEDSSEN